MQGSVSASTVADKCESFIMDFDEILILVLGEERSGKSTVCNHLLGEDRATVYSGMLGHTSDVEQFVKIRGKVKIMVIDTPPVPTGFSLSAAWKHLNKWHKLFDMNPDVVLYVIRVDLAYTPGDFVRYNITRLLLQNQMTDNIVLALTHGEELQGVDIGHSMEHGAPQKRALYKDARGRHVIFFGDNRDLKPDYIQQVINVRGSFDRKTLPRGTWVRFTTWLTSVRQLPLAHAIFWSAASLFWMRPKTMGLGPVALFFIVLYVYM